MLEDHTVDFIKEHKFGHGFLGEHGGELIHNEFNKLNRTYCKMREDLDRAKACFFLALKLRRTCPDNFVEAPKPQKRKKGREE